MWTNRASIRAKFLRNMIFIAVVSILLWSVIWIHGEYSNFRSESESLRADYIESQKKMLKFQVASVVRYINYIKDQNEQEVKRTLKERVYEAHDIAMNIYSKNKESKNISEIAGMIKDALRPARFNAGRGYYFAVSMEGVEQLYPVRPEFEGENLIDLQDLKGNFVIQDEINVIKKSGEGFVTDYWTKPNNDTKTLFPKISFVKHFKPLNWYFGAGEYLEDAKEQIQYEILNRIVDLRFGEEGYFFGSTFSGGSLFSNGKIDKGGSNIWNLTDPNGVKIIQEQKKAAQNPEGGFVSYFWHKLDEPAPSPKISFVYGIPEWEWTIGAGVYLDTIENEILGKKKMLETGLRKKLVNSSFALITLLLLIYFWSKRISKQLANAILTFSSSLKRADSSTIAINPDNIDLQELKDIAVLTNKMLEARKKADDSLRESEKKYRAIFENIQDVYYESSIDGTILEVSPSIENVSQYKRNELLGKSLYDIYVSSEQRDELLKLILDKEKVSDFEITLTDKDGSQHPCSISTQLVRDEQDNPIKLVGTARDIGERKRSENERKRLEFQLLQAQKMESIGNLAGGIAHDFNNILSSVIGFTELSLDEVEKGTHLEDNLQEVYTAGKRAKDLVRQILAFARQSEEELKPIQVDTIATEVLKFIRSSIPTTIEIKQNIESDSLIMGNATQVHQILMNLFTNAAHAMEDNGGILAFSLKDVLVDRGVKRGKLNLKPGNYIEIKVSDTGAGVAPEIIGSIFDPYFTTKGPGEGTGMGLAMVHGIIEGYGGKISVDSKLGQGTLFTIYLPVTRKRQEHHPYQSETLPTGRERILFVDDEASITKMGSQVLERLGYAVTTRVSSVEAIELFKNKPNDFDLVITDMTMPNMTGDKLAVELMKIRPDIPVILCTGYSKKLSDESAAAIGIKAFAYKPVVKVDLAKTVRKVLDEAKNSAQQ